MKRNIRTVAAVLLMASLISLSSLSVGAVERRESEYGTSESSAYQNAREGRGFTRYELSVSKLYNKSIGAYEKISVIHNSRIISADARIINGAPYVSVKNFVFELGGMTSSYNAASRTLNVRGAGFEMDVIDGGNVVYANGRTLFSMTPSALMSNGAMYAPLASIAKALGLSYSFSSGRVTLFGGINPIKHGNAYYAEDAVYWLSRIISAESRGESLLGQIAVGSVVLNRVKSSLYPNTIWGVIFDKKYGVQFSPILDGSIYQAPAASAVVAAKICLEGFNVNTNALFFLYPKASTSSWIPNNREYLFSIGKHDFYA